VTVYLLCFDRPYHHARHYLGFAENLEARLAAHRKGTGARLVQVIAQAGIGWRLVRTWPGGNRALERRLKNQKHGPRLCPICAESRGASQQRAA
jgi:predicted GIY-YIG superfamily endonuclease